MQQRFVLPCFLLLLAAAAPAAEQRTTNFVVVAADANVCQTVAQWAEHYRREKALLWLGQEMPTWPQPCPLHVQVSMNAPSGETTFNFGQGRVLGMRMEIRGPLDRLIHSVLPHEITHTVFAHHFRTPVPRWADEGGSVLSEDEVERDRHDKLTRQILNRGEQIPLRTLLNLKQYPQQVHSLYAQGFSMTNFLVQKSDRRTFLNFVGAGMTQGWDVAARSFYSYNSVEELEQAWMQSLRDSRRTPEAQLASNTSRPATGRPLVRTTLPPAQPLEPSPVVRGARPADPAPSGRPEYLPGVDRSTWQPAPHPTGVQLHRPEPVAAPPGASAPRPIGAPQTAAAAPVSPIRLGAPETGPLRMLPPGASPVGFPR